MSYRKVGLVSVAIVGVLFVGGEAWHARQLRTIDERRGELSDSFHTPYLLAEPDKPKVDGAALLIHGWRCNSSMMLPLARMLARNGVPSYVIDLPGHGRSTVPLLAACSPATEDPKKCRLPLGPVRDRAGQEILDTLIRDRNLGGRSLAILGHSWGGNLVDSLDSSAARIVARVNLEGRTRDLQAGRNHLFVANPWFQKHIGVGHAPKQRNKQFGSFADGTAYELFGIRRRHLDLIHDQKVNQRILSWLSDAFGRPLGKDTRPLYREPLLLALLLGVLIALLLSWLPWSLPPAPSRLRLVLLIPALIVALPMARLATQYLPDIWMLARKYDHERLLICFYLGIAGLVLSFGLLMGRVRTNLGPVGLGALQGLVAWLLVYASVGWYVDAHFYHQRLELQRWPRFIVTAVATTPLAWALGQIGGTRSWLRVLAALGGWACVLWIWGVGQERHVYREALELIPLSGMACLLGGIVESRTGSSLASSLYVSLSMAWFLATGYPVLG